ncbi:hypothetical protein SLEP1_g48011 [Rubroshorea leprosula]|uniref:Uncharacterized protein n=1 Tax=Rubroshorea leprosula TaxID=152421 RepID=A0AAV5LSE9_9ROSI|nr:hypothetical protein SLEP1_g48011 [Rubroshorea leprosula]
MVGCLGVMVKLEGLKSASILRYKIVNIEKFTRIRRFLFTIRSSIK